MSIARIICLPTSISGEADKRIVEFVLVRLFLSGIRMHSCDPDARAVVLPLTNKELKFIM